MLITLHLSVLGAWEVEILIKFTDLKTSTRTAAILKFSQCWYYQQICCPCHLWWRSHCWGDHQPCIYLLRGLQPEPPPTILQEIWTLAGSAAILEFSKSLDMLRICGPGLCRSHCHLHLDQSSSGFLYRGTQVTPPAKSISTLLNNNINNNATNTFKIFGLTVLSKSMQWPINYSPLPTKSDMGQRNIHQTTIICIE